MSDAKARTKFSCPACGGEAEWNPAKQALVCPYCGTTSPAQLEAGDGAGDGQRIVEHDLVRALREIPDEQRGWQAERVSVRCQSCQAISVFSPEKVSQACDFCGSTALIAQEDQKEPFRPESLVPMQVNETAVRESVRTWYGSHFWAPSGLGKKAMTDRVGGLYIPYWTFDAHAEVDWTADSGTYYYETRTVNGKT
jgi:Zn finger protein HypA/HybF involved in hydrogenase expression